MAKVFLNVNVTLAMEVADERAAETLRDDILSHITDEFGAQQGLYEVYTTQPYSAYEEGPAAPEEHKVPS